MSNADRVRVSFVDSIPRDLDPGVLYVSMTYGTAIHLCMCGCGTELVTPFAPNRRAGWTIYYDGTNVSLTPSIGNAAQPCRSHYFIDDSRIVWMPPMGSAFEDTDRDERPRGWRRLLHKPRRRGKR
jgi:hypothetical protein